MSKFLTISKQILLVLCVIVLILSIEVVQATSIENFIDSEDQSHHERRTYDLNNLRRFLLTSNAEQRAAKREQENFLKRNLIREYLDTINDPDPDRVEQMKKRIKTFCNSYEDVMDSDVAACG